MKAGGPASFLGTAWPLFLPPRTKGTVGVEKALNAAHLCCTRGEMEPGWQGGPSRSRSTRVQNPSPLCAGCGDRLRAWWESGIVKGKGPSGAAKLEEEAFPAAIWSGSARGPPCPSVQSASLSPHPPACVRRLQGEMDLGVAGLVWGGSPSGLRRPQCFLSVLALVLSCPGHVLPSCRGLSWSSEARVPRVPAPAPSGAAQGSAAWPPHQAPNGAPGGSWQCFCSAFLTPPRTVCAGPVVLVCLVSLSADRCTGSEVCHVGFAGASKRA